MPGISIARLFVDIYMPARADLKEIEDVAHEAVLTSKFAYLKKPVVVNVKDKFEETHLTHLVVKAYVFDTRYEKPFCPPILPGVLKRNCPGANSYHLMCVLRMLMMIDKVVKSFFNLRSNYSHACSI